MSRKILIIGFDALCWEYMNFLISRESLPNFSKLWKKSVSGPLKSAYPPGTYIAWPSFMTGVNPGKHSLFYPISFKDKFDYEGKPFNTSMIKYPTIYEILSEKLSVGVINQPAAFPPIKVNGFFTSKPPSQNSDFTYPKSLQSDILSKFPDFGKPLERDKNPKVTLKNAMNKLSLNYEVSKFCFSKENTDVKASIFMEVDAISHWYWDKPEIIDTVYSHCDTILGKLLNDYSDHEIVVLSDHGFGRCLSIFYPNVWLEKLGLLKWKKPVSNNSSSGNLFSKTRKFGKKLLQSLNLYELYSKRNTYKANDRKIDDLSKSIDWNKTKIYFREDMGFRFNIIGREKRGIIGREEAAKIFKLINDQIAKVEDPHNFNFNPFKGLIKNKDVFEGPHISKSPDFYIDVNDNYYRGFSCKNNSELFEENFDQPGKHTMNGIYSLYSKDYLEDCKEEMKIDDLVPHILYMAGFKSRNYFDGNFNSGVVKNSTLSRKPFEISEESFTFERSESNISDSDRESITEFWKDVGYL